MECYIINPALSLLMKHLVIGQRQKTPNFSAFHRSPHGFLVSIGQHFVTTRVVHLPKRTETSLITKSDQTASNHQLCTACTAWFDSGPGCAGRAKLQQLVIYVKQFWSIILLLICPSHMLQLRSTFLF